MLDDLEALAAGAVDDLFDGQYRPLTGDRNLAVALTHVIKPCSCIIETGTYHGNTTQWFRRVYPDKPYFGVEIDESKWAVTREHAPDAAVYLDDSMVWLKNNLHRVGEHPFFFLDAHGFNDRPGHLLLEDELELLEKVADPVIYIHDFNDGSGADYIPGNVFGGPVSAFSAKRPDLLFYVCALPMKVGGALFSKIAPNIYWKLANR